MFRLVLGHPNNPVGRSGLCLFVFRKMIRMG